MHPIRRALERTWLSIKEIMAPGALDPLTKEMIYLAVSVTNGCGYCIASHSGCAQGGDERSYVRRADGRVGMANETNRLANGYRVPIDPMFDR